ncbi:FAD-dependent oxidoreductase [Gordonia zhaorongruii]|uniref:FAD-dependent oxidoreductase n=1 Tax=Gordonia zhaorongruii TaxID=2597659 RepID=UPI001042D7CE|nr:FAD-dependent oxidoreductase [Gordonia zhaorongruii]
MTFVITRPCCNDASCVSVCPVNCIHPTPEEPEFATAEMLYIDPETCIDCGACVDACPVGAIFPDDELEAHQEPYLQINSDYYLDHEVEAGELPMVKAAKLPDRPLDVAIVGAGPAAFYAAEELVRNRPVRVDMYDRLPTPYGLVRAGVAPDHAATKGVERTFASTARKRNFRYLLGVTVGSDVTHAELAERYHAVLYASGASADKRLGIDGEALDGVISATDFVAWYNGHPDHAGDRMDLSSPRVAIIGNGNVALDVARILLTEPDSLATTDIADHALDALRGSAVREVQIIARRSIAHGAYTNSEFVAIGQVEGVDVVIDEADLTLDGATERALTNGELDSTVATKIRLAREYAAQPEGDAERRVVFRYLTSPIGIEGHGDATGIRCVRNRFDEELGGFVPGDESSVVETGLVVRSIGYRGEPMAGLPFDADRTIVPNDQGRVLADDGSTLPGLYVAGWLKRGATGGIGTNRFCGQETATALLADHLADRLPEPERVGEDVHRLLEEREVAPMDAAHWQRIDTAEREAGHAQGRPRIKIVDLDELRSVAVAAGD